MQGGSIWRLDRIGFPHGPGIWDNPETFILLILAIFYAYHAVMLVFGNFHLVGICFGRPGCLIRFLVWPMCDVINNWLNGYPTFTQISRPRTLRPATPKRTAGGTPPASRAGGIPRLCCGRGGRSAAGPSYFTGARPTLLHTTMGAWRQGRSRSLRGGRSPRRPELVGSAAVHCRELQPDRCKF